MNWEAASLEVLQSATEFCAEGDEACQVEQLIDIKSALEGRVAGLDESAASYDFDDLGEYLIKKGADDSVKNADGLTCYEGLNAANMEDATG